MKKNKLNILFLILIDVLAYYTTLTFAFLTRKALSFLSVDILKFSFDYIHFLKLWWIPLVFLLFIGYEKLYTRRFPFWDEVKQILKAVTLATLVIFAIVSLGKITNQISRLTIIFIWLYGIFIFPIFRLYGKKLLFKAGLWQKPLIIIGAGETGIKTAEGLLQDTHTGYEIIGFLDDFKTQDIRVKDKTFPILGKINDFDKLNLDIDTVVVAIPSMEKDKLTHLINHFHTKVSRVFIIPDLQGVSLLNSELYHLFMQQLFMIRINNNLKSKLNQELKRAFDLVVSVAMLPVLLPVMAIIAIIIKLDSKGNIFFIQERLGKNGRIFYCYKFRTMYENNEEILNKYLKENPKAKQEWDKYKKLRGYDPRITRIGRFLRKTSLDELPQIFNVLKGDMSLVGPRPYLPREIDDMGEYKDIILMSLPGITGLWQVSGRNELEFRDRLKLDTWYVLNWSLWLDIVILFKTIKVVLKREGAY
ncbi:undecaprenyl-phosphate galactose phosphotransferase WbaP [Persephonella sp. IF05-L8]|uniref:undecaprenyl-phosphate galactose phosphotransferase WbaP n=1 Tax=Persephonella sp. IF05-L8 TaxID=1158338 RepID=UPI0030BA2923